jgi:hypothetical protein
MDTGFAQVISSALGAIASVVVAIIAGYFTVRAAEAKVTEKTPAQQKSSEKPAVSWRKITLYALLTGIVAMPLGFAIAYTGNSLSGVPQYMLFGDSLDPALVSGILCSIGFMLGAWTKTIGLGSGRMLLLFLIVTVFSAPVAYSLAYTGNWLSGTSEARLFDDSVDALMVGALLCSVSFLLGALLVSKSSKDPA